MYLVLYITLYLLVFLVDYVTTLIIATIKKNTIFFEDIQSMSELSNRAEVNSLKLKLQDLTNISFYKKLIESILRNEIIPHIASFSLKKWFNKSNPHCIMCRNKLTYGYDISDERKKSM